MSTRTSAEHKDARRYWSFTPEVTTGNIIQILGLLIAASVAYATYREDQTKQDSRILSVEVAVARDRSEAQAMQGKVEAKLEKLADQQQDIKESLAILRGRAAEPRSK
jgi:hypothetical protein